MADQSGKVNAYYNRHMDANANISTLTELGQSRAKKRLYACIIAVFFSYLVPLFVKSSSFSL
jgi:hypothetical protein